MLQRVKEVQESDLRMVGALARNIQRVIAVTQADIDAAAAQGKAWVVKPVVKVSDPLDNLRGGTQLVIKQNSILPGQNVMRVMYIGGQAVVVGPGTSPLSLPDAIANSLSYVKAFGGTEQNGTPTPDAPVDIVSNNGVLKARHQSGLPLGYTLLEYVRYSGSAVSLLIAGFDDTTSEIHMGWKTNTASVSSNYQSVFTVWTDNQHNSWRMLTYLTDVEKYYVYGNSKSPATARGVALDTWHDLVCKSEQFIIDSTTYNTTASSDLTVSTKPIAIGSAQLENYYKYIKIKRQGEWIANFVPAKRKSDGMAGLYDLINNRFIEASTFTAGPEVSDPVEVYTDGTVETINAHGKNLFDKSDVITGKILNDTGSETFATNGYYSGHITVRPSTVYTVSQTNGVGIYLRILEYDSTNTMVKLNKGITEGTQTKTFTTDANTAYVIVSGSSNGGALDTVQLEQGSTATTYQPYFDGGTATAEMLLKVGKYQDQQEILSGAVTRNVGVKVLNGTENFETATATNCYSLTNTLGTGNFADRTIVCSHFASTSTLPGTGDRQGLAFIVNKGSEYTIAFGATTQFSTQALWQQFLADQYAAGTPVIVVYPLATETTESVTGQTLQVTDGDNVLEITQASLSGLELEAEYEKVA